MGRSGFCLSEALYSSRFAIPSVERVISSGFALVIIGLGTYILFRDITEWLR